MVTSEQKERLISLRNRIDAIDSQLLTLLAKRIELVQGVGDVKKEAGMPVRDEKREEEKIASLKEQAASVGISGEDVQTVWHVLFEIAYKVEE